MYSLLAPGHKPLSPESRHIYIYHKFPFTQFMWGCSLANYADLWHYGS